MTKIKYFVLLLALLVPVEVLAAPPATTGRWYWAGAFRKDKVKFQLPTATTTHVPKYRFRLFRKRR